MNWRDYWDWEMVLPFVFGAVVVAVFLGLVGCEASYKETPAPTPYVEYGDKLLKLEKALAHQEAINAELYIRLNVLLGKSERLEEALEDLAPGAYSAEASMQELDERMRRIESWMAGQVDPPSWCPKWLLGKDACQPGL